METKKAEPFAHEEEEDKRTCDFTTLLLLSLKRKLYDRLKQGCFRLGYRPSTDLLLQKHISKVMEEGDGSQSVESSETSTVSENSARSDVFFMCDGQWRSNDWQSMGVNTVARRQQSTTVVRRRRMNVSPAKALDESFEARVSAVSEFNIVQTFLPWFLPWILTVLTFLLTERPSQHQLQKQRKEKNLKIVRSEQYRTKHRRRNSGMKAILPAQGSSSLLLLATSLPRQDKRTSKDSARGVRRITRQCAAVAKVNRMPIRGLPPCPRLIMSPSSSPRMRTCASEEEPKSDVQPVAPRENKKSVKVESLQPFKILSQSPKKIVIELEGVEQLEGLLSKQFAQQDANKIEMLATPSQETMDSDDMCGSDAPDVRERCLVNCNRRMMDDTASEDMGIRDKRPINILKPDQSRKAQAIDILKAKKARNLELARSRESQCSVSTPKFHSTDREDNSREASDTEPMPDSVSSSVMEEFFSVQLEGTISNSSSSVLDSDVCISTQSSGVPSMSTQTMCLVRQNSRHIAADLNDSFSSSTTTQWPSIEEDSSLDMDPHPVVKVPEKKIEVEAEKKKTNLDTLPEEIEKQERLDKLKEMMNPEIKPSVPRKSFSPFSAACPMEPVMPKPQRPLPTSLAAPPNPPPRKPAYEESITEPRKLPKRAPPPPPPPKPKEKKVLETAFKKPPPPSKGKGGARVAAPPPPPPGKKKGGKGGSGIVRAPKVIEMFQAVRKATKGRPSHRRHKTSKDAQDTSKLQSSGSGGDAIIKELEKNSRYFAQIQSDVETHGPAIQKMIQDITSHKFESMAELNAFVKEIDNVLETFADETAVLRHFEWPHKYYTYREALALWAELKNRTDKCRHWVQGTRGISGELHRMKKYMELNIRRLDEVQRTLEAEVKKFIRNGIPWDSSVIQKVHDGTMCLLEKYMQIVYDEVSRTQSKPSHREKNVQYLTDTINLTFKIHQFVGGLTESCTSLFEKIAAFTRTLNTDL